MTIALRVTLQPTTLPASTYLKGCGKCLALSSPRQARQGSRISRRKGVYRNQHRRRRFCFIWRHVRCSG